MVVWKVEVKKKIICTLNFKKIGKNKRKLRGPATRINIESGTHEDRFGVFFEILF